MKVIIDYVTSSKHQTDTDVAIPSGGGSCSVCLGESIGLDSYPRGAPHDPDICPRGKGPDMSKTDKNCKAQLLFCPPRIWAFSLRHKTWKPVSPGDLQEVQPNDEPIEHLWKNSENVGLLETILTSIRRAGGITSLDTIADKGQGLNIIIQGESGTGKTLTVGKSFKCTQINLRHIHCAY